MVGENLLHVCWKRDGVALLQDHFIRAQAAAQSAAHDGDVFDGTGWLGREDACAFAGGHYKPVYLDASAHERRGEEMSLHARLRLYENLALALAQDLQVLFPLGSRLAQQFGYRTTETGRYLHNSSDGRAFGLPLYIVEHGAANMRPL